MIKVIIKCYKYTVMGIYLLAKNRNHYSWQTLPQKINQLSTKDKISKNKRRNTDFKGNPKIGVFI